MNKVVFSSPGESTTYKRFQSQGTALPDSPLSRKTLSVVSPKEPLFQSNLSQVYGQDNRSVTSKTTKRTQFKNNPTYSEDSQALLNQFKGSPEEYYKTKSKILSQKNEQQQLEINQLKSDNEKLRNLNFDYVKQINLISHEKLRGIEKIVITSDVFDIENIEQKSVKAFVRKLANNYKIQEREQKKLIDHCRIMEADIEVYKTKMEDADTIVDTLKKTGETSVQGLMKKLKDFTDENKRLEEERAQLSLNNAILKENLEKQGRLFEEVSGELSQQKEHFQDLKSKHNRLLLDKEDDEQGSRKKIYTLKCKVDELEFQLRRSHLNQKQSINDKIESEIKNKELDMINKTLVKTTSGFFNAKKYLTTSNGFRFK